MDIGSKEANTVNLINSIAAYSSDESTTQDTLDKMLNDIQEDTIKNMQENMSAVDTDDATEFDKNLGDDETASVIGEAKRKFREEMEKVKTAFKKAPPREAPLPYTLVRDVNPPRRAHEHDAGLDFFMPNSGAWENPNIEDGTKFDKRVIELSKNPPYYGMPDSAMYLASLLGLGNQNGTSFVPTSFVGSHKNPYYINVLPNGHLCIPSGVKVKIPRGLGLMLVNDNDVSTGLKLDISSCLIDSEYRGEIMINFFNNGNETVYLSPGQKIAKAIIIPMFFLSPQQVDIGSFNGLGEVCIRK